MSRKPAIVMFVGIPGSGKTTFARQLAKKLDAVVLNSDSLRIWMWGSREAVPSSYRDGPEVKKHSNMLTFGAMNYAANQIVATGRSVVYDCNANHYYEREEKYRLAEEHGAVALTIRIKVPYEVSLERVQSREESHDQRQMSAEKAKEVLGRFVAEIEEPGANEHVIEIDGEQSFDEQYATFQRQFDEVLAAA